VDVVAPLTGKPFTRHTYPGVVPGFVAEAVKVVAAPRHTVVVGVEMLMVGTTVGSMVIVIQLEVAGLPVAHPRPEVITQHMISPFTVTLYE
jgi:hypothetical protein